MSWIGADSDLAASVDSAKKNTQVFYEDDYPAFDAAETGEMVVAVSGDRSFQAAMRLKREHPDAKVAVKNFANVIFSLVNGGVRMSDAELFSEAGVEFEQFTWIA